MPILAEPPPLWSPNVLGGHFRGRAGQVPEGGPQGQLHAARLLVRDAQPEPLAAQHALQGVAGPQQRGAEAHVRPHVPGNPALERRPAHVPAGPAEEVVQHVVAHAVGDEHGRPPVPGRRLLQPRLQAGEELVALLQPPRAQPPVITHAKQRRAIVPIFVSKVFNEPFKHGNSKEVSNNLVSRQLHDSFQTFVCTDSAVIRIPLIWTQGHALQPTSRVDGQRSQNLLEIDPYTIHNVDIWAHALSCFPRNKTSRSYSRKQENRWSCNGSIFSS
mmetsp:Transcript_53694/g.78430  ORF Transcript_53694/g.78430 Transcript_53694/m.78430 type:complete len:273 (+) Transcript_53694:38-856(+)